VPAQALQAACLLRYTQSPPSAWPAAQTTLQPCQRCACTLLSQARMLLRAAVPSMIVGCQTRCCQQHQP
jgi:hypothetical protein